MGGGVLNWSKGYCYNATFGIHSAYPLDHLFLLHQTHPLFPPLIPTVILLGTYPPAPTTALPLAPMAMPP